MEREFGVHFLCSRSPPSYIKEVYAFVKPVEVCSWEPFGKIHAMSALTSAQIQNFDWRFVVLEQRLHIRDAEEVIAFELCDDRVLNAVSIRIEVGLVVCVLPPVFRNMGGKGINKADFSEKSHFVTKRI